MIRFSCNRTSEDRTPVIRDVEISRFAEAVLYDYRPELLSSRGYTEDTYYCPELLDPYDFAEKYLGAAVDVQDQANIFAASMLMPPRVFMPYVESIIKRSAKFDDELMITRTFNDGSGSYWEYRVIRNRISRQFGVSARAAELQLARYGLLAYPKDDDIREARRRLKMYRSLWA